MKLVVCGFVRFNKFKQFKSFGVDLYLTFSVLISSLQVAAARWSSGTSREEPRWFQQKQTAIKKYIYIDFMVKVNWCLIDGIQSSVRTHQPKKLLPRVGAWFRPNMNCLTQNNRGPLLEPDMGVELRTSVWWPGLDPRSSAGHGLKELHGAASLWAHHLLRLALGSHVLYAVWQAKAGSGT